MFGEIMPKEGGSKTKTLKQNCTKGDRSCTRGFCQIYCHLEAN